VEIEVVLVVGEQIHWHCTDAPYRFSEIGFFKYFDRNPLAIMYFIAVLCNHKPRTTPLAALRS
jgi:hypothetical protein